MFSFGTPHIDDDGVQIELYSGGMPVVTGVAMHAGKGPEETTLRAARDARRTYKQIRATVCKGCGNVSEYDYCDPCRFI